MPKIVQNCVFFSNFLKNLLFGRVSTTQKLFNDNVSRTSIAIQLGAGSLKLSKSKGAKSPKMDKNVLKLVMQILLHPAISQYILKSHFSFNHKKSNLSTLSGLSFSFVWCKCFNLFAKCVGNGLKKGQFCDFHDMLTPMTQHSYIAFASNWNFNYPYEAVFLRRKEGVHLESIREHNQ